MFEKLLLKRPFEKFMDKAIEECKKSKYKTKEEEELNILENSIKIFINDMEKEKLNKLLKAKSISETVLRKRLKKVKYVLYKMLEKRLKKMKKEYSIS